MTVIRLILALVEGHLGYVPGPKLLLSATGRFEVAVNKVRFKVPL